MSLQDNKKLFRKSVQNSIIAAIDSIFPHVSDATKGYVLFQLHFWVFGLGIVWVALFGKRLALQVAIFFAMFILILFYVFDGCILTRIEQHYSKEKKTTVDVFLHFFNIKPTREAQITITTMGYSLITICFIVIYIRSYVFT